MDGSLKVGRLLFAIAMVSFGFEFFLFVAGMSGPLPGPPWSRGVLFLDWLACAGFVFAGLSIATGKMARLVATFLGVVLLLYVVGRYMSVWLTRLHDPGPWTVVFEILAMVGGAWVLAAGFPADVKISYPRESFVVQLATVGRFLIAISLVVFAVHTFYVCPVCGEFNTGVDPGAIVLGLLYRRCLYCGGSQYRDQNDVADGGCAFRNDVFSLGHSSACASSGRCAA
jgi:hypothetical protein